MVTADDYIVHDTVSYDNTMPVMERIHRLRRADARPMFRGLVRAVARRGAECRLVFDETLVHHAKGAQWIAGLGAFFTPPPSQPAPGEAVKPTDDEEELRSADEAEARPCFRIGVTLEQLEVHHASTATAARAVACVERLAVTSGDIVAGATARFRGELRRATVHLIDATRPRPSAAQSPSASGVTASPSTSAMLSPLLQAHSHATGLAAESSDMGAHWQQRGYAQMASLASLDWEIVSQGAAGADLEKPEMEITITSTAHASRDRV